MGRMQRPQPFKAHVKHRFTFPLLEPSRCSPSDSPLRGVGLFPEAARTESGYRQYTDKEVSTLRFIRQSRDLGFSIEQIRELLGLWQNRKRPSRQVRALAQAHIEELDAKLKELQAMKATLEHLVHCCHGDDRPDCPIIENLAQDAEPSAAVAANGPIKTAGLRPGRAAHLRS